MFQPTITLPFTRAITEAFLARGLVDRAELKGGLRDTEGRVPIDVHDRMWERVLSRTNDPLIGLKVGLEVEVWHLESFGLFLMTHETVHGALSTLIDFLPSISGGFQLALRTSAAGVTLVYTPVGWRYQELRAEVAAGVAVSLCRWMTGERPALEISLRHAPRAAEAAYEEVLDVPTRFRAPGYEIFFSNEVLAMPLIRANARAREQLREVARAMMRAPEEETTRTIARAALLKDPQRDRSHLAMALGMSVRSLTRKLAEEGTTYGELRQEVLVELSKRALREGLRGKAIAERLGFADESGFTKAFRRWTGETPAQYRRAAQAAQAADEDGRDA